MFLRFRRFIRNYFGFSAGETNGFLILLPLMAIFLFSEPAYRWWFINYSTDSKSDDYALDSLISFQRPPSSTDSMVSAARFEFDPNTASEKDFINLGVSEKLSKRILHYRAKGGKFKIKNDFRKIYGMDSVLADQLSPFISLPEIRKQPEKSSPKAETKTFPLKPKKEPFDINTADSTQLMALYGIGSKLSKRIIRYRDRLGGFVSMNQLGEVYGLDSLVIGQLKKNCFVSAEFQPRKIDLNKSEIKELISLPYLNYNLAKAITAWRFQHGGFKNLEELKQIVLLDIATFEKIKSYLTVKE